jgi:hypothetical protein
LIDKKSPGKDGKIAKIFNGPVQGIPEQVEEEKKTDFDQEKPENEAEKKGTELEEVSAKILKEGDGQEAQNHRKGKSKSTDTGKLVFKKKDQAAFAQEEEE